MEELSDIYAVVPMFLEAPILFVPMEPLVFCAHGIPMLIDLSVPGLHPRRCPRHLLQLHFGEAIFACRSDAL